MLRVPEYGWAIVDGDTDKLAVLTFQVPIYWRRNVAIREANERGLITSGAKQNARVCRVEIRQYSPKRIK